jgi:23S rRNA (cytidine1920-2'-O)/16S rRNA (cytidine1409-2'-O)-methyltransferase
MSRVRLDSWLVDRGYFSSRQQAQRSIQAGQVFVNDAIADKPGTPVSGDIVVRIKSRPTYVSRGGDKLAGALQAFGLRIRDRICLDGGISTGGFTDCLLQHGAREVYGIDVGYGQVAWSLQTDARVHIRERVNLRYLTPAELYPAAVTEERWPDLGTVDVSFISLTQVLPALWHLLRSPKEVLLLVKPQFEAGRDRVGKKGVVRDPDVQAQAIDRVLTAAQELGWHYRGVTWSPTPGPAGNIEFWLWLADSPGCPVPALPDLETLTRQAQMELRAGVDPQ